MFIGVRFLVEVQALPVTLALVVKLEGDLPGETTIPGNMPAFPHSPLGCLRFDGFERHWNSHTELFDDLKGLLWFRYGLDFPC